MQSTLLSLAGTNDHGAGGGGTGPRKTMLLQPQLLPECVNMLILRCNYCRLPGTKLCAMYIYWH